MLKPQSENGKETNIPVIPLNDCLAKTIRLKSGNKTGLSVELHCRIVGNTARELISRLPIWLQKSFFPNGSELIAAAHDIGKVSPTFQQKIYSDIGEHKKLISINDKDIGYHSAVSQATTKECPKYIAEILGKHHGFNPNKHILSPNAEQYGGDAWQKQRIELLNRLKKYLNVDWPQVKDSLSADVLAGLTSVADWIGSGSFFSSAPKDWCVTEDQLKKLISESVDQAGFVPFKLNKGLTFKDIFEKEPRPVQLKFSESVNTFGAYVLEAPMGIGKTEAALYAAYQMLEKNLATGIYFALPTQLTSDKLHERMKSFLVKILSDDMPHREPLLLHSFSWLKNTELGEDGSPGGAWYNSTKRGILAPFAVGTIDQALMAVMNVKHGFVRTFGLAGKVVILDEVHSYDSYTGTILKELVSALRQLQCTVIILSATLTDHQRYSIIGLEENIAKDQVSGYPLISCVPQNKQLTEFEVEILNESKVSVLFSKIDRTAQDEAIYRAERGEQVLWIENTVVEAQDKYKYLASRASELSIECGLLHSRFIPNDRRKIEEQWVNLFGKEGHDLRKRKGRILIGTQVLEQSLDIDADFLVTRFCPTDMLLQRIGRLWRHEENNAVRPKDAKREVLILCPELQDAIENQSKFGKSAKVYSPYILCRTLEGWQDLKSIVLPTQIKMILEDTYKERNETGKLASYKFDLEKERNKLASFALLGISRGGKTVAENKAFTRYSQIENVDVLLIKKKIQTDSEIILKFLDNSELPLPTIADKNLKKKVTVEILKNTVRVPEYAAPVATSKQIGWLKDYIYLGSDDDENLFRVGVVQENDEIKSINNGSANSDYELKYESSLGYGFSKTGGKSNDDRE